MCAAILLTPNNTLYFTPKQFGYLLDRRLKDKAKGLRRSWLFLYIFLNVWTTLFFGGIISLAAGKLSFIIPATIFNIGYIVELFRDSESKEDSFQVRKANARRLQIVGGIILTVGNLISVAAFKSWGVSALPTLLGILSILLGTRQLKRQKQIPRKFIRVVATSKKIVLRSTP